MPQRRALDDFLDGQPVIHLLYRRAVDLRIRLILARLGFSVRTVSTMEKLLDSSIAGMCQIIVVDVASELDIGIGTVEQLGTQRKQWLIVPVCSDGTMEFFRRCFKAGAVDVLDKSFDDGRIAEAFRAIKRLGSRPSSPFASARERQGRFQLLSPREQEVFRYLVEGFTSREIGPLLTLSARTVDLHRAQLHKKLCVRNVAQMACEYSEFLNRA
jgi:two-component system response regulator FixJ